MLSMLACMILTAKNNFLILRKKILILRNWSLLFRQAFHEAKQIVIEEDPSLPKPRKVSKEFELQTSCNKVVVKPISGCVRTACSQLLWQVWNKLLSPCYKVDDGNRLATGCCNNTNTGYS
jgi:hypothetical protein